MSGKINYIEQLVDKIILLYTPEHNVLYTAKQIQDRKKILLDLTKQYFKKHQLKKERDKRLNGR